MFVAQHCSSNTKASAQGSKMKIQEKTFTKSSRGSSNNWSWSVGAKFFNCSTDVTSDRIKPVWIKVRSVNVFLKTLWNYGSWKTAKCAQGRIQRSSKLVPPFFSYWRRTFYINDKPLFAFFVNCIQRYIFVPAFTGGCIFRQKKSHGLQQFYSL